MGSSSCGRETVSSLSQAVPQAAANLDQNLIADGRAHGVIEHFEGIEIHEQDGVLALRAAACTIKQMLQAIEEETAVGQSGQRVVIGIVLQLFFGSFALGDVAIHDDQFRDLAFLIADSAGERFQNPPGTVFVADAVFELSSDSRAARLAGCLQHLEAIVRVDLLEGRGFPQFGRGIAENSLVGGTVVKAMSFDVDQRDQVGGVFGDDLEQLLALLRIPVNAVHAELLVDHGQDQGAESDPIPLRHDLMRRLIFKLVFKEDIGNSGQEI